MYTYERPMDKEKSDFTGYMIDEASIKETKEVDFSSIYRSKEFNECMKYFDTSHDLTRKVLLSVNEADQNVVMQALASKLYGHIVDKVDDIDFGTIPSSKGDITKIQNFEQLTDCINVLSEVLQNYNQPTDLVDTVSIALQNMVDRREIFIKAYRLNVEIPIVTYNTIALSIVSATSLLIASSIEFIKLPDNRGFDIAFDKTSKIKSKDKILFKNLESFNKMCVNGQFDQTMNFVIKNNLVLRTKKHEAATEENVEVQQESITATVGGLLGGLSAGGHALVGLATGHPIVAGVTAVIIGIIVLIQVLRGAIYYFFYARTKASEYFDAQSALLVMNAYNVESNLTRDETERKKIAEKQNRVAKFFAKLSDALKVKDRTAEAKASSDIDKQNKEKFVYTDIMDSMPDSAQAALF